MNLMLNRRDLSKLSPSTRAELAELFFPKISFEIPEGFEAEDFDDVVELTPSQIEDFMAGCSDVTIAGLRIIAEHGPKIHAEMLSAAGITNYGSFQGSVTKRARTISKNKDAFLLTWDDWTEHEEGVGYYAVSQTTFRSLREFFDLD